VSTNTLRYCASGGRCACPRLCNAPVVCCKLCTFAECCAFLWGWPWRFALCRRFCSPRSWRLRLSVRDAKMTWNVGIPRHHDQLVELVPSVPARYSRWQDTKIPEDPAHIPWSYKTLPVDSFTWTPSRDEIPDPNPPRYCGGLLGQYHVCKKSTPAVREEVVSSSKSFLTSSKSGSFRTGLSSTGSSQQARSSSPGAPRSIPLEDSSSCSEGEGGEEGEDSLSSSGARGGVRTRDHSRSFQGCSHRVSSGEARTSASFLASAAPHSPKNSKPLTPEDEALREREEVDSDEDAHAEHDEDEDMLEPIGEVFDDLNISNTRVSMRNSCCLCDDCLTYIVTVRSLPHRWYGGCCRGSCFFLCFVCCCGRSFDVYEKAPFAISTYIGFALRGILQKLCEVSVSALPLSVSRALNREALLESSLEMRYRGRIAQPLFDAEGFSLDDGKGAVSWKNLQPGPAGRLDLYITRWLWRVGVLKGVDGVTAEWEEKHDHSGSTPAGTSAGAAVPGHASATGAHADSFLGKGEERDMPDQKADSKQKSDGEHTGGTGK